MLYPGGWGATLSYQGVRFSAHSQVCGNLFAPKGVASFGRRGILEPPGVPRRRPRDAARRGDGRRRAPRGALPESGHPRGACPPLIHSSLSTPSNPSFLFPVVFILRTHPSTLSFTHLIAAFVGHLVPLPFYNLSMPVPLGRLFLVKVSTVAPFLNPLRTLSQSPKAAAEEAEGTEEAEGGEEEDPESDAPTHAPAGQWRDHRWVVGLAWEGVQRCPDSGRRRRSRDWNPHPPDVFFCRVKRGP